MILEKLLEIDESLLKQINVFYLSIAGKYLFLFFKACW